MIVKSILETRKRAMRKALLAFLAEYLIPDYVDYSMLDDIKVAVDNNKDDIGECQAFCDYFKLGDWFAEQMVACEFDLEDFYKAYEEEIEWRSDK